MVISKLSLGHASTQDGGSASQGSLGSFTFLGRVAYFKESMGEYDITNSASTWHEYMRIRVELPPRSSVVRRLKSQIELQKR